MEHQILNYLIGIMTNARKKYRKLIEYNQGRLLGLGSGGQGKSLKEGH